MSMCHTYVVLSVVWLKYDNESDIVFVRVMQIALISIVFRPSTGACRTKALLQ